MLAKFVALALLLLVGIVVEALATYVYSALLFTAPDPAAFVGVVLLLYLYLLVLTALALLASTLGQTTIAAGSITFLFVILLMISGIFANFAPGKLVDWSAALAMGMAVQPRWDAVLVTLLVTGLAVAAACVVLNRQEITSASGT